MATTEGKQCMEAILRDQSVGHLAMTVAGELYLIPINYTYTDDRILFHCALEGKKLEMIRRNPHVCFEVSRQEGPPTPHVGDACSAPFESVVCWGTARVVDDVEERLAVLNEFQSRYPTAGGPREPITRPRAERCGAVEIRVTRMTGRRRAGEQDLRWEWEAAS